jgi:hypothetical protein
MWDFQLEETIVEAFDMIVEEDNVPLIVDIDDYPQRFNEIVETWCVWIWYQGFKVKFKDKDMSSKTNAFKDYKYANLCFLVKTYDLVFENGYPQLAYHLTMYL